MKEHSDENDRIDTHRFNGTIDLMSRRISSTKYFFIPALSNEDIFTERPGDSLPDT